jgi:hypothetical protein
LKAQNKPLRKIISGIMEIKKMKNIGLQICSWLVLSLSLAAVSVEAQSNMQYKAEIPFDFNIGNNTYKAGDYVLNIKNTLSTGAILEFRKASGHTLRVMFAFPNGNRTSGRTKLFFDRSEDGYTLKKLIAPEFGLTINTDKNNKRVSKKSNAKSERVALSMKPIK